MASCQCVSRFFYSICLKYCVEARSYEVLHLSRKIILANLTVWCSKMQRFSGNQRPDLPTSLMNMSFVLHLPREIHLSRSSSNAPRLPSFLEMLRNPHVLLTLGKVQNPLHLPGKTEPSKVVRAPGAFNMLTWKYASHHNGAHFFDMSTSKSAPVGFVHFDFDVCFMPQRLALSRHLNYQKCSKHSGLCTFWPRNVLRATTACTFSTSQPPTVLRTWLCTFWLRNVLRATTACTFSTSELPKVVREWCALYVLTWKCASRHNGVHFFDISTSNSAPNLALHILTSKCASRHNGVQFFISHLVRWLCTRRFSEPTFRPSRATKKNIVRVSRDFSTFPRTCIFFLLTRPLLWSSLFFSFLLWLFPPLLFHLSILSEVWLLNFLRFYIYIYIYIYI